MNICIDRERRSPAVTPTWLACQSSSRCTTVEGGGDTKDMPLTRAVLPDAASHTACLVPGAGGQRTEEIQRTQQLGLCPRTPKLTVQ